MRLIGRLAMFAATFAALPDNRPDTMRWFLSQGWLQVAQHFGSPTQHRLGHREWHRLKLWHPTQRRAPFASLCLDRWRGRLRVSDRRCCFAQV